MLKIKSFTAYSDEVEVAYNKAIKELEKELDIINSKSNGEQILALSVKDLMYISDNRYIITYTTKTLYISNY